MPKRHSCKISDFHMKESVVNVVFLQFILVLVQNNVQCSGQICSALIDIDDWCADGWTTDDLKYQWKKDEPVQITHDLHLPRFTLEKYVSDYCNIKTNTGQLMMSSVFNICPLQDNLI